MAGALKVQRCPVDDSAAAVRGAVAADVAVTEADAFVAPPADAPVPKFAVAAVRFAAAPAPAVDVVPEADSVFGVPGAALAAVVHGASAPGLAALERVESAQMLPPPPFVSVVEAARHAVAAAPPT